MPYDSKMDLPEAVQKLSSHLQDIWLAAFNTAWKTYKGDEATCFRVAWGAVNKARGQVKASIHYYPKIHASTVGGKRFIEVDVLEERVSRPLESPVNRRWKVDEASLKRSVDTIKGTVLMAPVGDLATRHSDEVRPVGTFVDYVISDGKLRAKYELIESDSIWAEYAWSNIQAGLWDAVSVLADYDYNYPIEQEGDIFYPHRFKLNNVEFVTTGAFPGAGVAHTFTEGIAAALSQSFLDRPDPTLRGTQSNIGEKKMSEEQVKELEELKKQFEEIKASKEKGDKDYALLNEHYLILQKKAENVDTRTLEVVSKELEATQKRLADLEKQKQDEKNAEKRKLASEVSQLKVDNGLIMSKDVISETEHLEAFDTPALQEIHASLSGLAVQRRYLPKTLPNSSTAIMASMSPKERRRMELHGEFVNDKGELTKA